MLLNTVLTLFFGLAAAAPTKAVPASILAACKAKVFNKPWLVTDITVWEPTVGSVSKAGQITFHFCDPNDRLRMETDCIGEVTNGTCEGQDSGYVSCKNTNVAFKLDAGQILVERTFTDDCLGPYPYNSGIAFGQNKTKMFTESAPGAGAMSTQEQMLVNITSLA